jgi:hypothetical protein
MRRSLLVLVLVSVLVTACGEDRGRTGTTATTTAPVEGGASEVPAGVAQQYRTIEEEIREEGGETRSGPWRIGYIVEPAEGWFERKGERLEWRPPARGETNHIEILPIEAETGRLVPGVPITLEVLDADGDRVARKPLSFYYAEFFHYAENFALPGPGRYTLRATIGVPPFRRHGEEAEGARLAEAATVDFKSVDIDTEEG